MYFGRAGECRGTVNPTPFSVQPKQGCPVPTGHAPDPGTSNAPYRVYNIGNNRPVELLRLIEVLEDCLGKTAEKNLLPIQPGDVPETFADVDDLVRDVGFRPETPIEVGVARFVEWYRWYHKGEGRGVRDEGI